MVNGVIVPDSAELDASPVPLVLGVVGHRDPLPGSLPRLRRAVRRDLEALIEALPETPLLMLNGLAEGMDQEVAELFLEVIAADRRRRPDGPPHQLVATLPLRPDSYRTDFEGAALEWFEDLLRRCDAVLEPGNCAELRGRPEAVDELARPDCYAQQGTFLVRHAYLLLACHNGVETMAVGGSAQAVAMQKGLVHPLFLDVDEVIAAREPGSLIEYDTPRRKNHSRVALPPRRAWVEAQEAGWQQLLDLPKRRLETINRAIRHGRLQAYSWAPRPTVLWHHADAVANSEKSRHRRRMLVVLISGWLITLLLGQQPLQLVGMALIVIALALFPRVQQGPRHRFIVHRCLAESLTVQEFWADLGVNCDVADLFHSQTHNELGWIRTVLRARRLQLLAGMAAASDTRQAMATEQEDLERGSSGFEAAAERALAWMQEQERWLQGTILRQERHDRWLQLLIWSLGGAALLMLLLSALPEAQATFGSRLGWLIEGMLASFAALLAYRELLGYEETNARYRRSRDQFGRGLRAFEQAYRTPADDGLRRRRMRCALEAVGREKIDELNDWVSDQLKRVYRPGS